MQRRLSNNTSRRGHWPDAWSDLETSKGGISAHLMIQRLWWSDQPLKVFTSLHKHLPIHTHIHWHILVAEATMQSTTCSSGGITTHKRSHSDGRATRNNLRFSILPKTCRMQDATPLVVGRLLNFMSHSPVWRLYCDLWWWTDWLCVPSIIVLGKKIGASQSQN